LEKIKDVLSRTLIWRSFFDMVKDAKITSRDYINFVVKNITQEKSDSIFERQFDLIHAAITSYTPIPYRQELGDIAFNLLLDLLKSTSSDNKNRIVILKSKLTSFAFSDANKKVLIDWRVGKFELLKEHPMTVVQEWSAVVSAFTLKDWSIE
jgi:aminopeptidase N